MGAAASAWQLHIVAAQLFTQNSRRGFLKSTQRLLRFARNYVQLQGLGMVARGGIEPPTRGFSVLSKSTRY